MSKSEVGLKESRCVQDRLLALFKRRGHGTKARVERELGLYGGYFDNRRGRGDISFGVLVAALKALNMDVGQFIADALGETEIRWDDDQPPPIARDPATIAVARLWGNPIEGEEND